MSFNPVLVLAAMLLFSFLSVRGIAAEGDGTVAEPAAAAATSAAEVNNKAALERYYYNRKTLLQNVDYTGQQTHPNHPHELEDADNIDYDAPHIHPPPVHKHAPGNSRPERHLVDTLDYVPPRTHNPAPAH